MVNYSQLMESDMTDELKVYGISRDDIRNSYMNSVTAKLTGLEMVVMGILSDCQEMIAMKNPTIPHPHVDENIRQQLNIAKFILSEMMQSNQRAA
jgi:methyl coenzyme M reductase subunit C-like uncharacterized protein (methanogenesis marker protein 7)